MSFWRQSSSTGGILTPRQQNFFSKHGLDTLLLRPAKRLVRPYAWLGHLPFAAALVRLMKPRVIVELGTHTGNSFCGFCQSVAEDRLDAICHAVDTWQGDEQAGYYDDAIYEELFPYVQANYGRFARLLRMTFDEGLDQFRDGSIDLLHIDGLHTYEAVRHDFERWKSKMSPRGVILFHDTQVFDRDFGVHRLWAELGANHTAFEFTHSHGLGVLLIGAKIAPKLMEFTILMAEDRAPIQMIYERASLLGLAKGAFEYQRSVGSEPFEGFVSLDCELFLDHGNGFNEVEKLISGMDLQAGKGVICYDLGRFSKGLSRLRFDPGHKAIALQEITARLLAPDGNWRSVEAVKSSAIGVEDGAHLFGDDPWLEFVLPDEDIEKFEVTLHVKVVGTALSSLLATGYRRIAAELETRSEEKETLEEAESTLG